MVVFDIMTASPLPTDETLFESHSMRPISMPFSEAIEETWTVFLTNTGQLMMVLGGFERTFLEGESELEVGEMPDWTYEPGAEPYTKPFAEWACHSDPAFVRPAQRLSEYGLSWDAAANIVREHFHDEIPRAMRYEDDAEQLRA